MAQPAAHFAVGMACGAAASLPLVCWPRTRRWLVYAPLWVSACGVWALVPDLPQILRQYPSVPNYRVITSHQMKTVLHEERFNWLFFFHASLDHNEEGGELVGMAWILVFYNAMVLAYIVYVRRLRRKKGPPPLPRGRRGARSPAGRG